MEDQEIVPKLEAEVYQKQIALAESYSTTLAVKDEDSYKDAFDEAKLIKMNLDKITKRKEEMTKPLNATLKSIRAFFAPWEERGETALTNIKRKMTSYSDERDRKIEEKKAKIDAKVDAGKMGEGVASAKKFMMTPEKTVSTEMGSATTKKVKKYYVVNKELVPLQFLEPDMVRIKASFKAGTPVPGVEERLETELAIR